MTLSLMDTVYSRLASCLTEVQVERDMSLLSTKIYFCASSQISWGSPENPSPARFRIARLKDDRRSPLSRPPQNESTPCGSHHLPAVLHPGDSLQSQHLQYRHITIAALRRPFLSNGRKVFLNISMQRPVTEDQREI